MEAFLFGHVLITNSDLFHVLLGCLNQLIACRIPSLAERHHQTCITANEGNQIRLIQRHHCIMINLWTCALCKIFHCFLLLTNSRFFVIFGAVIHASNLTNIPSTVSEKTRLITCFVFSITC